MLRQFIKDESIDLIYLDPPFNSKSNYNVIFKTPDDKESASQITAFEDTWHWHTGETEYEFNQLVKGGGVIAEVMKGLELVVGKNDLLAYLTMMAIRLRELYRVLKDTGSLYLHCDPTASHYLKIILDAIFEAKNFRNDITWKRSTGTVIASKKYRSVTDSILFYTKSDTFTWNQPYGEQNPEYIKKFYKHKDEYGLYIAHDLTQAGTPKEGSSGKKWRNMSPGTGKHWITIKRESLPPECRQLLDENYEKLSTQERLEILDKSGLIHWPKKEGGRPRLKRHLSMNKGLPISSLWIDVQPIASQSNERMGYPTQKPITLLERIIKASSNEGDIVLDPFCGCGTAIIAGQKLKRNWIGMDITHLAIGLMEERINDEFKIKPKVIGNPASFTSAENLFKRSPLDFERWAVTRIDGIHPNKKQVGDGGVDGRGYLGQNGEHKVIVSVKGGKTLTPSLVAQLIGVMEKEHANFGILITIHKPTNGMLKEAISQGFVDVGLHHFPKIQIWTISDYFNGIKPKLP